MRKTFDDGGRSFFPNKYRRCFLLVFFCDLLKPIFGGIRYGRTGQDRVYSNIRSFQVKPIFSFYIFHLQPRTNLETFFLILRFKPTLSLRHQKEESLAYRSVGKVPSHRQTVRPGKLPHQSPPMFWQNLRVSPLQ